jgi:hypothetical protein
MNNVRRAQNANQNETFEMQFFFTFHKKSRVGNFRKIADS